MKCLGEHLESFVRGELPAGDASAVAVHVRACAACAEEAAWLRTEREAMANRQVDGPHALRMLEMRRGIERRLDLARRTEARWHRPQVEEARPIRARAVMVARGAATAIAAMVLALVAASLPMSRPTLAADGSSCVSVEAAAFCAVPSSASASDELAATMEAQFSACLVASPWDVSGKSALCN